jgi:predicted ribosomally synthesized peptide with nif11-like leader
MRESLLKFLEKTKADPALNLQVRKLKDVKDFVALGKSMGHDFSEVEVTQELAGNGEVTEVELQEAAGATSLTESGFTTCPCTWQD